MKHASIHAAQQPTVLLVGDNSSHRSLLAPLTALGINRVKCVPNNVNVLTELSKNGKKFDLIFFEVNAKFKSCLELVQNYMGSESGLVLIASNGNEVVTRALRTLRGCDGFVLGVLEKPLVFAHLRNVLAEYFNVGHLMKGNPISSQQAKWPRQVLVDALCSCQFVPYFQPQIDLATGELTSAEALVRWNHPSLGTLLPGQFLHAVESWELLKNMTDNVLHQALVHANQLPDKNIEISVNFSPIVLESPASHSRIYSLVADHGVSPEKIIIEVTETSRAKNSASLLTSLSRLRDKGFAISADDFGVGYSSLQELRKSPFTEIKIDRTFITGMATDKKSLAILDCIVSLAEKLDIRTVAEGIETAADLSLVRSKGFDRGQGYFLGRPMVPSDLIECILNSKRKLTDLHVA
jgi:EAL domain-containing protein (putative c-di-GMP-specific phosphodiesterase class I)